MELTPFATLTLHTASEGLHFLGTTPVGTRIIQEITGARLEGSGLAASLKGAAAADWLAVDAAGVATFDIRMTLLTDDGATLYLRYEGRADWSGGLGRGPIDAAFWFEAGDERYTWLNALLPVGRGSTREGGEIVYDLFRLT
ncbi:MAG: DUF3237 family protein [Acidobacteria bacterium]|nr:DUF3237 family protein [Acidobacteriota bacterium]